MYLIDAKLFNNKKENLKALKFSFINKSIV